MATVAGKKRKIDYNASGTPAQARKRQKGRDARAIATQTADAALSTTGELNISAFVKAREFEIAALDQSMRKARKGLNQRAFQQVPRHLRRRTASHNVKKVPKRLRRRAAKEILEDNTPTGRARVRKLSSKLRLRLETAKRLQKLNKNRKTARQKKREARLNAKESDPEKHVSITRIPRVKKNTLAKPPLATSKFKRRQVNKTWLPTHIWHTKRAHMTRPTLPLWRMAIPLRPNEKSYRPTHRAIGARGCVAWDVSYMSTVGCQGTEATLLSLLKAFGFHGEGWTGAKYRRWVGGTRHAEGWIAERDNLKAPIAPVTVFWQTRTASAEATVNPNQKKNELDRRLFIRIHPSAFHHFWLELLKVAKMQKPQVLVEDLRFEIGSISICGPGSSETLAGVVSLADQESPLQDLWSALPSLSSPSALPKGAMLALDAKDPRYNHPPRQVSVTRSDDKIQQLNELIVAWPPDQASCPSRLFDHKQRYLVSITLPSQKAINRRKTQTLPGQEMIQKEADPKIPIVLLVHRSSETSTDGFGTWTMLMPWSCVDLLWRSLMYYPLTTGSTPRFGGLEQTQQVAFEEAIPWFPGDFQATEAGKAWERSKSEERFDTWIRRPTSKRIMWELLDLGLERKGEHGRGWTCDWEFLFHDASPTTLPASPSVEMDESTHQLLLTQRQRKAAAAETEHKDEEQARRRNTSSPESDTEPEAFHKGRTYTHVCPNKAATLMKVQGDTTLPVKPALATIRITFLTKGTPKAPARIYRLPSISPQDSSTSNESARQLKPKSVPLRQQWLALDPNPSSPNSSSSTSLPQPLSKEHRNHHGDPVRRTAYDPTHTRDLSHIRVFPPRETNPKVTNMFGPKPPPKTVEETLKMNQPQEIPKMIVDSEGKLVKEEVWDRHVPCPDKEDLIGFVTSGGYSLSKGRGTAIGSVWVQRVVRGWREEEKQNIGKVSEEAETEKDKKKSNAKGEMSFGKRDALKSRDEAAKHKQIERQRHLCVVRNAGESVGRLAIWELV